MIEYIVGDIFTSPAQVIVNTVNTVGVMGKGLALSFKQRYPDMFNTYREACEKHKFEIGKLMLWQAPDYGVLLFPTKENWRNPSKLEYIEKGLIKFSNTYDEKNITSIAFPRLGCGNGELNWDDVKPLMEKYLKPLPIDIYIYIGVENMNKPESKSHKVTLKWLKENARDMSFNGIKEDIILNTTIPHGFKVDNYNYFAQWRDENIYYTCDSVEIISVDEDTLFEIWDSIRIKGVFPALKDNTKQYITYGLLNDMGYLSKIKILDKNILKEGYQVNEGPGRIYSLKGA